MQESSSVIMAESAAMALASTILNQLQCRNTTILFDNQQLVHLLNEVKLSNPPDWRIKPFTQIAANLLSGNSSQVRRIKRNQNQMADSLAKQALHALTTNHFVY
jgi:ribonuclease HI